MLENRKSTCNMDEEDAEYVRMVSIVLIVSIHFACGKPNVASFDICFGYHTHIHIYKTVLGMDRVCIYESTRKHHDDIRHTMPNSIINIGR